MKSIVNSYCIDASKKYQDVTRQALIRSSDVKMCCITYKMLDVE